MSKKRTEYAYVAHRIDSNDSQNLGDFSIRRLLPADHGWRDRRFYHYNSVNGRLINRGSMTMPVISNGSRIYRECIKAVERLLAEEAQS